MSLQRIFAPLILIEQLHARIPDQLENLDNICEFFQPQGAWKCTYDFKCVLWKCLGCAIMSRPQTVTLHLDLCKSSMLLQLSWQGMEILRISPWNIEHSIHDSFSHFRNFHLNCVIPEICLFDLLAAAKTHIQLTCKWEFTATLGLSAFFFLTSVYEALISRPRGLVGRAPFLTAQTEHRWWFESLLVHA